MSLFELIRKEASLEEITASPCIDQVNAKDVCGYAPIHCATFARRYDLVEWFLTNGADVNARTGFGETALHKAAALADRRLVTLLRAHGALDLTTVSGHFPIHYLILSGHAQLLDLFANTINATNEDGRTPLMLAIQIQRTQLVPLLIRMGADLEVCDYYWLTALHIAAQNGQFDTVKMLVEAGANLDCCNRQDDNAAETAANARFLTIARFLVKMGTSAFSIETDQTSLADNMNLVRRAPLVVSSK